MPLANPQTVSLWRNDGSDDAAWSNWAGVQNRFARPHQTSTPSLILRMKKPIDIRAYLQVPFAEKDEAKKLGARWEPERKQWWVDRKDLALNPGIHRWMVDGDSALAMQLKAADDFLQKESAPKSKPKANKRHALPPAYNQTEYS